MHFCKSIWIKVSFKRCKCKFDGKLQTVKSHPPNLIFVLSAVTVTPLKLSPRALVHSRRTSHIVQQPVILSPDPDLLIPIRPPLSRYVEEEGEGIIVPAILRQ